MPKLPSALLIAVAPAAETHSERRPISSRSGLFRLVLEGQLDLGPVEQVPTVTNDDVLTGHLGHSDITHRSPRRGDGLCRSLLPGGRTRPDHIDYPVHAHGDLSSLSVDLSMVVVPCGSVDG